MYNLNWHLKESNVGSRLALNARNGMGRPPVFHNIGNVIEDKIMPNQIYNIQIHLYHSIHVKFNLTIGTASNIGKQIECIIQFDSRFLKENIFFKVFIWRGMSCPH